MPTITDATAGTDAGPDAGGATAGLSRRSFLKAAGLAGATAVALPTLLSEVVLATPGTTPSGDLLVSVFMRGAMDGLSAVVPTSAALGSAALLQARPSTAVLPTDGAIDLGGGWALHPALAPLMPLWTAGHLAIIHAVGHPTENRSHFEVQAAMDAGGVVGSAPGSGWLGRELAATSGTSPLRGVGLPRSEPNLAQGPASVSIASLGSFTIGGTKGLSSPSAKTALAGLYNANTQNALLSQQAAATMSAIDLVASVVAKNQTPAAGIYGAKPDYFGYILPQIAQLVKAGIGLQAASTDAPYAWDLHNSFGTTAAGNQHNNLAGLAAGLAGFCTDIGAAQLAQTTIVALTEFGRTFQENANKGLDHGRGSVMFVIGGGIKGGKVYTTSWPDLSVAATTGRNALQVTTDYRTILSEIITNRAGVPASSLAAVFPGFTPPTPLGFTLPFGTSVP